MAVKLPVSVTKLRRSRLRTYSLSRGADPPPEHLLFTVSLTEPHEFRSDDGPYSLGHSFRKVKVIWYHYGSEPVICVVAGARDAELRHIFGETE